MTQAIAARRKIAAWVDLMLHDDEFGSASQSQQHSPYIARRIIATLPRATLAGR